MNRAFKRCWLYALPTLMAAGTSIVMAQGITQCVGNAENWTLNWELNTYAEYAELADSRLNPGNLLAQLPRKNAVFEVRPDVRLECAPVTMALSPRFQVKRTQVDMFMQNGTSETEREEFINEGLLRWDMTASISLEASRQALLWGPSLFFSPSNPFTSENGRNSPYTELRGQDYLTARVYIGDNSLLSFYDNFSHGADDERNFEETYAITYEYIAMQWMGTLVLSSQDNQYLAGGFAQYTLTDSVVLFTDIGLSNARRNDHPLPGDEQWLTGATLGASYSFLDGSNISGEYFYNERGLTASEADQLWKAGDRVGNQIELSVPDPIQFGDDLQTLGQGLATRPTGLRQHYIAMQYNKNDIASRLDAVLRWTHSRDGGSLLVMNLNAAINDHSRIFLTLLATSGDSEDEFKQFYDQRITLGTSLLF